VASLAQADARRIIEESAWHHAYTIKSLLQVPLNETRALAKLLSGMLKNKNDVHLSRAQVNVLLRNFIENSPNIVGMSVLFEPNAYDGRDHEFAHTPGHDASGRFIPYWSRDAEGKGVLEALVDYEIEEYYLLPKQKRHEVITEAYIYPIQGHDVLMTTVVVPILDDSKNFIGMVTMDMALDNLQEMIETIRVGNFEQAYVSLFSAQGHVIASQILAMTGKKISAISDNPQFNAAVLNARPGLFEYYSTNLKQQMLTYVAPVELGVSGISWSISVSVAAPEIMAGVHTLLFMLAALAFIVVVVSALIAMLISRLLITPLHSVGNELQKLALGAVLNDDIGINYHAQDEIGHIIQATGQLKHNIAATIEQANAIAHGDYSHEVNLLSQQDQLGQALQRMTATLHDLSQRNQAEDWLKSGQARLAEKVSGTQELTRLAENILRFICQYLPAEVGVFYLAHSDPPKLTLIASYAYQRRKHLSNQFNFGEGVAGQAALEGKAIVISQVPTEYMDIESGCGKSAPTHLVALPFIYENTVRGVLELGTLDHLSALQLTFLNQSMPAVAIAIHSAQSRLHLENVLARLQAQQTPPQDSAPV
jgi:putative methionine-R-sulfoxide reductase with GAF domain